MSSRFEMDNAPSTSEPSTAPGSRYHSPPPSSDSFYRRASLASSCSWETGLSMYSSDMSLQSPTTPRADGDSSPNQVYIPDRNSSFNSMASDLPSLHEFSPYGSGGRSENYPAKDFAPLTQMMGGAHGQFAQFDDLPLPSLQTDTPSGYSNSGVTLLNDASTPQYKFSAGAPTFMDFSSPVDNWSTSSAGGNDNEMTSSSSKTNATTSAQTVVPSQTMTAPRTPQLQTSYPRSSLPSSTPSTASSRHHQQRGTVIGRSPITTSHIPTTTSSSMTHQSILYYPFTSPSPSVSPTTSSPLHSQSHHNGATFYTLPSSQPSTPSRLPPTRAQLRRLPSSAQPSSNNKRFVPPFIYTRADKKHKCRHPGCGGAFQRQEHLKRHETSHTGDRPHECKVQGCKFKGSRSDNLKQHMKRHRVRGGRVRYVPDLVID